MQRIVELFRQNDLLREINEPLDIDLEIPHLAYIEVKKDDSKALLFTNVVSKRLDKKFDMPVLMNVFGSFKALNLILGKDSDEIASRIEELLKPKAPSSFGEKLSFFSKLLKLKNVPPKKLNKRGSSQEIIYCKDELSLYDLPILKTWEKDGGAFITMGHVYTQSLNGEKKNVGMYRLQVYDKNHLGMHWQIHKDGAMFFNEYKKANQKMPVSVGIGGDPLYIWCGQAPLPDGINELLLYGFIREKNALMVKSITNEIQIPHDCDIVIEGFVDPNLTELEGPFGDHTGYYTPIEPYPVMEVTCISTKKNPIFNATVVGKPPLEDKYMGYATGRVFLPLLKTTTPDLIDYNMPENGVFHNLILAKMKTRYPYHAQQFMHAFWGVGQMSFVKHAIFVDENAPNLDEYEKLSDYILDRLSIENLLISHGVCDQLDHASPNSCFGGKLGVDCTGDIVDKEPKQILNDDELFEKISAIIPEIKELKQYKTSTKTPICIFAVKKERKISEIYEILKSLKINLKLMFFVDSDDNDIANPYMLVWRISNNIDALRDIYLEDEFIGVDATRKNKEDGYFRDWPEDVVCSFDVLKSLNEKNLIQVKKGLFQKYHV